MKKLEYPGKDLEAMSFALNYHRWIAEEFHPFLGNHAAEVGAGIGDFSELLFQSGVQHLTLFEPSQVLYARLNDRFEKNMSANMINGTLGQYIVEHEQCFDSIFYVNVLEHIENDKIELELAYQSLRNNGHILIFVPALSFLFSAYDKEIGHFRRYHKKALRMKVESAGFEIKKIHYMDFPGMIAWVFLMKVLSGKITNTSVTTYDRLFVPFIRKIGRIIRPPIGKNILLVGKKVD